MSPRSVRLTAVVSSVVCLVLLAHAALLNFYVEPTSRALADAQRGQEIGFFAVPGLALGFAAVIAANRRWAVVPLAGSILLGVCGIGFDLAG